MKPHKTLPDDQYSLLPNLMNLIDKKHNLIRLASVLPWDQIEEDFAIFYSDKGRKANAVRLMTGLLLLKYMYNVSDERLFELWQENPYWQAFCGITIFQTFPPCHPTDLVYFRKRIGKTGVEKLLKYSVQIHGKMAMEDTVVLDTTVQSKNITFPTDTKLQIKVIHKCLQIAEDENINLRRSYKTEMKKLLRDFRFDNSKDGHDKAEKAKQRIKKISKLLINEIRKKLNRNGNKAYDKDMQLYTRVVNQEKDDSNKIYSLHEPDTQCIAKGKSHIKYEFGSTVALAITSNNCIITGAMNFSNNPHDTKTIKPILEQIRFITKKYPKKIIADRGFRGFPQLEKTEMIVPKKNTKGISKFEKRKVRNFFRRRAAIEPVIGHLKSDFRMCRNFLKGITGDIINVVLSAVAFNCCKLMNIWAERPRFFIFV